MLQIWPSPHTANTPPLTRDDLCVTYGFPQVPERASVRVHMIMAANGTGTLDGLSAGLSSEADMLLFLTLRELADVVLVGAGTARAETYRGARTSEALRERRRARGQAEIPPIAVITARADIDPAGSLFSDTMVPPMIFTTASAPRDRVQSLRAAGADLQIVGDDQVELPTVLDALTKAGLTRVLCEGGPRLFGNLVAEDLVDELCLTVAPALVGNSDFIYAGPLTGLMPLQLMSVLTDQGNLFLRYRRDHAQESDPLGRPARKDQSAPPNP
jgi:riboflavin biosynthesis pyrimidine reductase